MNSFELTGRARTHVIQVDEPRFAAHPEAVAAFMAMRQAAAGSGFDLHPFSSFRDFNTQCRIWNMKFLGKKPLYDEHGRVRDYGALSPDQLIGCILNWSALPGGSRHHWGSEIDVVDAASMPEAYKVQLLPLEVEPDGIFHALHGWLDEHMGEFGFFRPYARFQGGMFPEPWHLSYAPVSLAAQEALSLDILLKSIESAELEGKALLLARLPEFYVSHVNNICSPTPVCKY